MNRLSKIDLTGFKSIQELKDFELMDLNVIIGANGAGKSNLVDFFRMLSWMINSPGNLQHYIGMKGGANSFLHEGAAKTLQIGIHLTISTDMVQTNTRRDCRMRLETL